MPNYAKFGMGLEFKQTSIFFKKKKTGHRFERDLWIIQRISIIRTCQEKREKRKEKREKRKMSPTADSSTITMLRLIPSSELYYHILVQRNEVF